jgi:hypothetical protein
MPVKHEHVYKPTNSKLVRTEDGMQTIVLQHCKCGEFIHSRLPGDWSWSEIMTKRTRAQQSDRQFMRAMGIRVGK